VSAGDGSVGQLLGTCPFPQYRRLLGEIMRIDNILTAVSGYHYLWSITAQVVGTPQQIERENKRYVEGEARTEGIVR
jgi:hypothetical protein